MIALGQQYGKGPLLISVLSEQQQIPIRFLETILLDLKSRELLTSKRGKGGGYELTRPPSAITIGSLIRIMEGPLAPLPCASETAYRPCDDCRDVEHCGTRIIMRQVRDAIADVLDRTTLGDVIAKMPGTDAQPAQELMYYI